MSRILLLGLVGIWAAGLVAYVTWPNPNKYTRPASKRQAHLEQQGIFRDYSTGAQAFQARVPMEKACSDSTGAVKSACLQGFMVAEIREMLQLYTSHSQDASVLKVPDWAQNKPETRVLWYMSLGMALDQLGAEATAAKQFIKDDGLFKYVVDGWAFGHSLVSGLSSTLEGCAIHLPDQISACLFGTGRSAYFLPQQLAQFNEIPQSIKDGYLYSQAFNSTDPTDEGFKTQSGQAGRKVLALWTNTHSKPPAKTKWLECMSQKHITECKTLF